MVQTWGLSCASTHAPGLPWPPGLMESPPPGPLATARPTGGSPPSSSPRGLTIKGWLGPFVSGSAQSFPTRCSDPKTGSKHRGRGTDPGWVTQAPHHEQGQECPPLETLGPEGLVHSTASTQRLHAAQNMALGHPLAPLDCPPQSPRTEAALSPSSSRDSGQH